MNNIVSQLLLDILSKAIKTKPDVIQFAKDRRYEKAWIIPISKSRIADNEIDSYLSEEPFKVLIVEYIWNSQQDDNRFVLTLFLDKKCKLQNPKEFVILSLTNFYKYTNFSSCIMNLDSAIIGKPYLFRNPVEEVNMSIFNHWLSVGPVDLWKTGEQYNPQTILTSIKSRPDIERSILNYQGLLFRFNVSGSLDGPLYGLKTPCCRKEGNAWIVDHIKVEYWMKTLLSIQQ